MPSPLGRTTYRLYYLSGGRGIYMLADSLYASFMLSWQCETESYPLSVYVPAHSFVCVLSMLSWQCEAEPAARPVEPATTLRTGTPIPPHHWTWKKLLQPIWLKSVYIRNSHYCLLLQYVMWRHDSSHRYVNHGQTRQKAITLFDLIMLLHRELSVVSTWQSNVADSKRDSPVFIVCLPVSHPFILPLVCVPCSVRGSFVFIVCLPFSDPFFLLPFYVSPAMLGVCAGGRGVCVVAADAACRHRQLEPQRALPTGTHILPLLIYIILYHIIYIVCLYIVYT